MKKILFWFAVIVIVHVNLYWMNFFAAAGLVEQEGQWWLNPWVAVESFVFGVAGLVWATWYYVYRLGE